MFGGKVLASVILFIVLAVIFKWWVLLPLGILILIFIIRLVADLFWYGKDQGKW